MARDRLPFKGWAILVQLIACPRERSFNYARCGPLQSGPKSPQQTLRGFVVASTDSSVFFNKLFDVLDVLHDQLGLS